MPKKSDAGGKKIKFWVVSCSCAGSVGMDILDELTFKTKNEAHDYILLCRKDNTRCDDCDAQIHRCEVVRKP